MIMNRRWAALALGLAITVTGGHVLSSAHPIDEAESLSRSPIVQSEEQRAFETKDEDWESFLKDFQTMADLDSSGRTEEAIMLWEELIPQVEDKLGVVFEEYDMPEGNDGDAEGSLEDLKGWTGYISTFSELIDDGAMYEQLMEFADDIDSLTENTAAKKKLESQIAILLNDALYNIDLTEVEGIFADPSEFDGMMSEVDLETYSKLLELYIADEEAGNFESAQDKYDEIIDLLNQYPEMSGEMEGELYAQFQVDDEKLSVVKNPLDEYGDPLEVTLVDATEMKKYQLLWDYVITLMPDSATDYVDKFEVGSDGKDGTMAYVYPATESLKKFVLNLDIKDMTDSSGAFNKKDMDETIVHEFGHIITLNHTQMTGKSNGTYETQEGILSKDSYMNKFYNSYWKGKTDKYLLSNEDGYREYDVERLYGDHSTWFVSDYAATNVEEDLAESFRVFVLEDKPTGNTIMDQKVNFFYQFPELVTMRDEIRDGK